MAEFRFSLGQVRDATDLVQNGDFAAGTGWTFGGGWVLGAGQADHTGARSDLTQAGIFTRGNRYELDFDIVAHVSGGSNARVGLYGLQVETANGSFTANRLCLGNEDLVFNGIATHSIDNVAAFEMLWNTPLSSQPKNWDKAKIVIEKDETINGYISRYITDLVWHGDGYDFLLAAFEADGYCAKIPVRIEYRCSNDEEFIVFDQFPEGVIYLSEATFDLEKCEVKAVIEERNSSQVLFKAKDVKVFAGADDFDYARGLIPANAREFVDFHNAAGVYPGGTYDNIECFVVEDFFRLIILSSTELEAEFESSFFSTAAFKNFCITLGGLIRDNTLRVATADKEAVSFSFKQLFQEMNKIASLNVIATRNSSNEPLIKIEDKQSFLGIASGITLNNVRTPIFTFNLGELFKTVDIGYEKDSTTEKVRDGVKKEGFQYVTDDQCSQNVLNLVSKYLQDGEIIEDILDGTIADDSYDDEVFIIQIDQASASPNLLTEIAAGNSFNGDTAPDDNMTRWVNNLNNSLFSERNSDTPETITKTNTPLIRIFEFEHPLSFEEFQMFTDFTETIAFNSPENGIETDLIGYLLRLEWSIKTGMASFKLKTE